MKQFFLVVCCMSVALSGFDAANDPSKVEDQSKVESVFFGSTGFFLVKKFIPNCTQAEQHNPPIKKYQYTIQVDVQDIPEPEAKTIKSIYSDALIMNKKLVILDPAYTETKGRFHFGFNPVSENLRKKFLQERLKNFNLKKNSTDCYATKEDEYHIHWHVKGVPSSALPLMVEHMHEGRCQTSSIAYESSNMI